MTDGQKKLVEQYAVMCNPDEVAFTREGLEAFIKAVAAHTLTELNKEVMKHARSKEALVEVGERG